MDIFAGLTADDIKNGAVNRMLANVGISNVHDYVEQFHKETENLIVAEFEQFDQNQTDNNDQIVSSTDLSSWLVKLGPKIDQSDSVPMEPITAEKSNVPTDLTSWMHGMIPVDKDTEPTMNDNVPKVTGDLGTWLNDWSKNLAQQPPPTSLDTWLQGMVPSNMHEPLGKQTDAKTRLNAYLNAAQKVLSKHGYKLPSSDQTIPVTPAKVGFVGNVKQMYFLWKTFDKNNDRKITVEDVEILFQEMGFGFLSQSLASSLFSMVDTNHDGTLQFRDFVAMMSIIKQLMGAMKSAKI